MISGIRGGGALSSFRRKGRLIVHGKVQRSRGENSGVIELGNRDHAVVYQGFATHLPSSRCVEEAAFSFRHSVNILDCEFDSIGALVRSCWL